MLNLDVSLWERVELVSWREMSYHLGGDKASMMSLLMGTTQLALVHTFAL